MPDGRNFGDFRTEHASTRVRTVSFRNLRQTLQPPTVSEGQGEGGVGREGVVGGGRGGFGGSSELNGVRPYFRAGLHATSSRTYFSNVEVLAVYMGRNCVRSSKCSGRELFKVEY